jgi:predicted methyltransferase
MKTTRLLLAATAAVVFAGAALAAPPAYLVTAVADPARPADDSKRDADRKPAETLAIAGVKPGSKVIEILPGGGYFTRILVGAVGPKGHVTAVLPEAFKERLAKQAENLNTIAATHPNLEVKFADPTKAMGAEPADIVFTAQNYHDFHNLPDDAWKGINQGVHDSLKPGGIYLVVDHIGAPGTGATQTKTLHRIEPAAIKAEVEAAGFKLVEQSDILKDPADDHTKGVFDPSIRGKTDQVIMKFKKVG